jgi:hypothetical protein
LPRGLIRGLIRGLNLLGELRAAAAAAFLATSAAGVAAAGLSACALSGSSTAAELAVAVRELWLANVLRLQALCMLL